MSICTNMRLIVPERRPSVLGLAHRRQPQKPLGTETLLVAEAAFWCVEIRFEAVKGVNEVVSGSLAEM